MIFCLVYIVPSFTFLHGVNKLYSSCFFLIHFRLCISFPIFPFHFHFLFSLLHDCSRPLVPAHLLEFLFLLHFIPFFYIFSQGSSIFLSLLFPLLTLTGLSLSFITFSPPPASPLPSPPSPFFPRNPHHISKFPVGALFCCYLRHQFIGGNVEVINHHRRFLFFQSLFPSLITVFSPSVSFFHCPSLHPSLVTFHTLQPTSPYLPLYPLTPFWYPSPTCFQCIYRVSLMFSSADVLLYLNRNSERGKDRWCTG